ncbi:cytochrome P450 [Suillus subluteus]|nr:cytochrome P450 [Suillus subluteus]
MTVETPLAVTLVIFQLFTVPSHLRHLPRVPIFLLLVSYLSGEVEDPYANERGEGLRRWIVHILDHKLAVEMSENLLLYPKELPPDGLLLWRFIGGSNILMANGDRWKKHSRVIHDAFNLSIPVDQFIYLSKNLFDAINPPSEENDTHTVDFAELAQRFALDAVGSSVLGHDFDAIRTESLFVKEYNGIMQDIANPLYLIMPFLEKVFPRKEVIKRMDNLVDKFKMLLQAKRNDPGDDMMTFMLKDPTMSEEELRDNMVVLFIAGHDTSAGSLSTLIYFLAIHPEIQAAAREETLRIIGPTSDPSVDTLSAASLPYLNACIREALRINTPISYIMSLLGKYYIPSNISLIYNIYAIHHRNDKSEKSSILKDAWVAFASGPRQCPARNFALYEQRALAVMLLREYEWTVTSRFDHQDGLKNAFSPFALTLPHDLDITFTKRSSRGCSS